MTSIQKLKARIQEKRAAAQKILNAVTADPITRDMNPDEKSQFDGLMSDVTTLKGQVAQLQAIEDDEATEDVAEDATATRSVQRSKPPGDAPAVHTRNRPYSILRAMSLAVEQRPIDGLEGEISREIAIRTGKPAKGFYMPTGADPVMRALMAGDRPEIKRGDLTTTTGAGAIFTLPELPLIDLLRAKLVVRQLGATFLTDMKGLWAIPRQTGSATVYWLAEGNSATATNPSTDQVGFRPRVAIAATNISRMFMNQTSLDAESFVKNDLAASMARELDRVAINGAGTTQPLGLLQNPSVPVVAIGTNGGVPTFATMVALESAVATANADTGSLAYLTNPALRGVLKQTPKIGTTFPVFLYEDGSEAGVGTVNGYPARSTTNVPSNLTKGTASGICSAILFGDWSSLVVAQWEGVDMLVNPYTNQLSGAVVISMEMSVDVNARHPESFAICTDAKLS